MFHNARLIMIDFTGPKLDAIPQNNPPEAIANCSTNAAIVENQVLRNPFLKTWRVVLKMQPKPGNTDPGGHPVHVAKWNEHSERNMDLPMESALNRRRAR